MSTATTATFTIPAAKRTSTIPSVTLDVTVNSGKRWTAAEDRLLLQYASTKSHDELSKDHKRSALAIRMRLIAKLHDRLDSMNYFSDPLLIQSVYNYDVTKPTAKPTVNNDTIAEITAFIVQCGSPSYEEIRTYHQMVEHKRKCTSNRRLINDYSTEPKVLDMTLAVAASSAFLNRFVATPVVKATLSSANTN